VGRQTERTGGVAEWLYGAATRSCALL